MVEVYETSPYVDLYTAIVNKLLIGDIEGFWASPISLHDTLVKCSQVQKRTWGKRLYM